MKILFQPPASDTRSVSHRLIPKRESVKISKPARLGDTVANARIIVRISPFERQPLSDRNIESKNILCGLHAFHLMIYINNFVKLPGIFSLNVKGG